MSNSKKKTNKTATLKPKTPTTKKRKAKNAVTVKPRLHPVLKKVLDEKYTGTLKERKKLYEDIATYTSNRNQKMLAKLFSGNEVNLKRKLNGFIPYSEPCDELTITPLEFIGCAIADHSTIQTTGTLRLASAERDGFKSWCMYYLNLRVLKTETKLDRAGYKPKVSRTKYLHVTVFLRDVILANNG